MSLPRILLVAVSLLMLGSPAGLAADWREFRGPAGLGVAADQRIRETWSETEGISWRADLPGRSASSPIVVGDLVVTTASSGARQNQLHVIALDRETGKRRWERTFWATGRTLCHPTSAVAANTPASDGERIVALFSSCDLFCLDLEGRLLWQRNLAVEHPRAGNDVGMGSSPRIVDDMVVVQLGQPAGGRDARRPGRAASESQWPRGARSHRRRAALGVVGRLPGHPDDSRNWRDVVCAGRRDHGGGRRSSGAGLAGGSALARDRQPGCLG